MDQSVILDQDHAAEAEVQVVKVAVDHHIQIVVVQFIQINLAVDHLALIAHEVVHIAQVEKAVAVLVLLTPTEVAQLTRIVQVVDRPIQGVLVVTEVAQQIRDDQEVINLDLIDRAAREVIAVLEATAHTLALVLIEN